jgi:hypothetical protein
MLPKQTGMWYLWLTSTLSLPFQFVIASQNFRVHNLNLICGLEQRGDRVFNLTIALGPNLFRQLVTIPNLQTMTDFGHHHHHVGSASVHNLEYFE